MSAQCLSLQQQQAVPDRGNFPVTKRRTALTITV